MKFKPPPKRKRVDEAAPSSSSTCPPQLNKRDDAVKLISKSPINDTQTSSASLKIQKARDYAVAQAQQDDCKGNFKVFDSPFGNYLVPAIPTRAELGD